MKDNGQQQAGGDCHRYRKHERRKKSYEDGLARRTTGSPYRTRFAHVDRADARLNHQCGASTAIGTRPTSPGTSSTMTIIHTPCSIPAQRVRAPTLTLSI
jgi:hypothetical protein